MLGFTRNRRKRVESPVLPVVERPAPKFCLERSARFFEFWYGLPRNGLLPDRSAFDPVHIRDLMPDLAMIELHNESHHSFRLAGTRLVESLGADPTGKAFESIIDESLREGVLPLGNELVSRPCGGHFVLRIRSAKGYLLRCEVTDLPMTNDKTGVPIVLSYLPVIEILDVHDEREPGICDVETVEWIDLGGGVPW